MSKLENAARLDFNQSEFVASVEIGQSDVRNFRAIDNRHMRVDDVRKKLPINLAAADYKILLLHRQPLEQFRNAADGFDAVDRLMRQDNVSSAVERFSDRLKRPSPHDHRAAERHRSEMFHVLVNPKQQSPVPTDSPISIDARNQLQSKVDRTAVDANDFSASARSELD